MPHLQRKPPATLRVGFFGDSYVEANQVPTEATFFRRLPALLAPHAVESLGFGLSGVGHAPGLPRVPGDGAWRYDLDVAVYVFVENDPGDSSLALSEHRHDAAMPYATLADEPPGYRVREAAAPDPSLWFRAAKAVQERSLRAQVVWVRLRLLQQEGLRPRAREEEREMRERAPAQRGESRIRRAAELGGPDRDAGDAPRRAHPQQRRTSREQQRRPAPRIAGTACPAAGACLDGRAG